MKTLIFGIILIIVIGLGGFFYRDVMERTGGPQGEQTACTLEAKLCPDGSSVGRTGPSCAFAPCTFPNVEVPDMQLAFVVPEGYTADENAYGAEPTLVAAFVKPSLSDSVPHSIVIRQYPVGEEETAEGVIIANTRYQPADMPAENMQKFETVLINGKTFRVTVIERFEALVQSAYYLAREHDVLKFEVTEHDVTDWMEPTLEVRDLPQHAALEHMLGSLQTTP